MSEDRQQPDSPDQVDDTKLGADPKAASPHVVDSDPTPGTPTSKPEFEPVSIRSYLAEQFGVREVTSKDQPAAPVASPTDANAELAKWRERVPKLASALRDRTEQISLLEEQVAQLQAEASNASRADLKASDDRVAELELMLAGLTANFQRSESSLNAKDLELEDLRVELEAFKQRWQSLTESLDAQVASTQQAQVDLQQATAREAELTQSNAALQESAELANQQLSTMTDELGGLQAQLLSQEQSFHAALAEQTQASLLETAQIQAEHSEQLRDIHAQTLLVFEAVERQNASERRSDAQALGTSLSLEFAERERQLQQELASLQQAAAGLMQQVGYLKTDVVQQQRNQLQALAQQEANGHQALCSLTLAFEAEIALLQQQLQQQQQMAVEPEQERVVLLGEISDANDGRSDFAREWRSLNDDSIHAANETIRELEQLLKIRNEELSAALAARVHFLPVANKQESAQAPERLQPTLEATSETPDDITKLRQQLESATTENERLRQQLERTSSELLANDDLTQLKGVGGKLAEQLRELGISKFAQLAALDMEALEQPEHPLHNMRGRIQRNGWIEQAKALVNPLTLYGDV